MKELNKQEILNVVEQELNIQNSVVVSVFDHGANRYDVWFERVDGPDLIAISCLSLSKRLPDHADLQYCMWIDYYYDDRTDIRLKELIELHSLYKVDGLTMCLTDELSDIEKVLRSFIEFLIKEFN